jgi:hypothetical protein
MQRIQDVGAFVRLDCAWHGQRGPARGAEPFVSDSLGGVIGRPWREPLRETLERHLFHQGVGKFHPEAHAWYSPLAGIRRMNDHFQDGE